MSHTISKSHKSVQSLPHAGTLHDMTMFKINYFHYFFILNFSDPCSSVDKKRRNIACSLHDYTPAQEPLLRSSLLYSEFVWSLPEWRDELKILEEIMHFHYMTYLATFLHKNPCPEGHEIYNFGGLFLGYHYYTLSMSDLCLGVDKKIFMEIIYFH